MGRWHLCVNNVSKADLASAQVLAGVSVYTAGGCAPIAGISYATARSPAPADLSPFRTIEVCCCSCSRHDLDGLQRVPGTYGRGRG